MKLLHPLLLLSLLLASFAPRTALAVGPWFERGKKAPAPSPFRWKIAENTPKSMPTERKEGAKPRRGVGPAGPEARRNTGQVQEGGPCRSDDDCAVGTYCDRGKCVKVTYPFHIPPYLFYRSYDGRFTEILGIYWHQRGTEGYQVVFPFYWHFWTEKTTSTFYTLFQYRRTPNERNYRLWPVIFYTSYGERGAGFSIMPLFHFAREGTRTAAVLPWLLSGFDRDPERGYSRGLAAGLYYWHRDREEGYRADAVFPIFYSSRGKDDAFTWVLPFNFHWRKGGDRTLMFLPLFYQSRSPDRTTTLNLVPPLYHRREGDTSRLAVLPLYFAGKSPLTGYRVLFPIFWQFYSRYHNFALAGPFFYRRRGEHTTAGLVPVAFYDRDREKGTSMATVVPLFYYGSEEHGRRASVVSPLFLYERDDTAGVRHWGLVVPPFYSRRDPDREVDALFPLAMRWRDKTEEATTWVVGPTVFYSDPDGGTQVLFPFFWRFSDTRTGAATSILFPFGYRHRRPDGTHTNLFFPFYYRRDRDGWAFRILPALYFRRSTHHGHAVLFPAFWHVRNPHATTTVLGPLYHRRTHKTGGRHVGLFPIFYAGSDAGERYGVLFPAFWYLSSEKEGYSTYVAGTAFYSHGRKGRVFGLLPVFAAGTWKGTQFQTVLPPLFYRSANPTEGRSATVAGPYIRWRDRDETGHAVVPLAYFRRSKESAVGLTIPLFYYRRRPEGKLLVTPLGGFRTRTKERISEGIIGPFVWHKSPKTRGFAVLPILYHWKRPQKNAATTVIFPLGVRHRSPDKRALVWFPFLWRYTDQQVRSLVIFPLYWRQRQQRGLKAGGTDADVLLPLYWSLRRADKQLHVIGPMFWARSNDWRSAGLFPLFLYRRNPKGTTFFGLPFAYYRRDAEKKMRTWIVGLFYRRHYERGSATGLLPLFFRKDTPESRYTLVAPLYWDWGSPKQGTRTVVAGPFFYRRRPDKRAFGMAPLFYRATERTGARSLALLPLFYQRSEPARFALYTPVAGYDRSPERTQWYAGIYFRRRSIASSLDIAFPLFVRHRNNLEGRTTFVMPGYYGRWSRERSFHLAFPIFWYQRRIDSSAMVLFPVFWDFNNRYSSRTTLLFPALLYHRDHEARSTSIVTPPALWLRFRPKATDGVLFPIFWHFSGYGTGATVVAPLWWDIRYTREKRHSVFFPLYWDFRYPKERYTLVLPLLYRYDGPRHRKYWVLNTWYTRDKRDDTYGLFCFPLFFSQRKRPGDFKLEMLLGLFGYERIGRNRLMTLFFYTFPLKPLPPRGGQPAVLQEKNKAPAKKKKRE